MSASLITSKRIDQLKHKRLDISFFKQWRDIFLAVTDNRLALIGIIILTLIVLMAVFADQISPQDPTRQNLRLTLRPPAWSQGGAPQYFLGTDHFGRDILSRLIHGARVSIPTSGIGA